MRKSTQTSTQTVRSLAERLGRRDYLIALENTPFYPDGTLRKSWDQLGSVEQESWVKPHRLSTHDK